MRRACYIAVIALCLATILTSLPCALHAQQTDLEYTPEQIRSTSAETFLELMAKPEPGYETFAAMHALGKKAKQSDAETRGSIMTLVVTAMNDKSRTEYQRFQCCYVISDCGDQQWLPNLVDVLNNDPSETMRSVAAEALGFFISVGNCAAARDALRQAALTEKSQKVLDVISKNLGAAYTSEQIKSISADAFLEYMNKAEPGYGKFAAMQALASKAKQSNVRGRRSILTMVVRAMNDASRTEYQRWQCCYVISGCGDEAWVQPLVDVLNNDPSATMRSVAAEALGKFPKNRTAHNALLHALPLETSQKVLDVINRVLGIKAPAK